MINVECNECPIRNFCNVFQRERSRGQVAVAYWDCPLMVLLEPDLKPISKTDKEE